MFLYLGLVCFIFRFICIKLKAVVTVIVVGHGRLLVFINSTLRRLRSDHITMCVFALRLLVVYLLLNLVERSVPVLLTHLISIGQFFENIDVVVALGSAFVSSLLNLVGGEINVEECAFKMK